MKITALLLTLALAQDGEGADQASQGATQSASQGASQSDSGYGGEAQSEPQSAGYEAEPAYTEEHHYVHHYEESAPAYVHHHSTCLGGCFKEAPCLSIETGACVPKSCGRAEGGYRRLQQSDGAQSESEGAQGGESDNSYGYEAPAQAAPQESYAAPQESYAAPVAYAAPQEDCDECPEGTVDSACLTLSSPWALWIGFVLLFIPSLWFICQAWSVLTDAASNPNMRNATNTIAQNQQNAAGGNNNLGVGGLLVPMTASGWFMNNVRALKYLCAGTILSIASLAYLAMASGHGYIVRCCDGRQFYYARYIDWMFTTPLMLWEVSTAISLDQNKFTMIFFFDILMITTGLIGSLVCGGEKWIFWGFGCIVFIPILGFLCALDSDINAAVQGFRNGTVGFVFSRQGMQSINGIPQPPLGGGNNGMNLQAATFVDPSSVNSLQMGGSPLFQAGNGNTIPTWIIDRIRTFKLGMNITVVSWFFYPIVWVFAEGTGALCANGEAICYTILDVIAKAVFAVLIMENRENSNLTAIATSNANNGFRQIMFVSLPIVASTQFPLGQPVIASGTGQPFVIGPDTFLAFPMKW